MNQYRILVRTVDTDNNETIRCYKEEANDMVNAVLQAGVRVGQDNSIYRYGIADVRVTIDSKLTVIASYKPLTLGESFIEQDSLGRDPITVNV